MPTKHSLIRAVETVLDAWKTQPADPVALEVALRSLDRSAEESTRTRQAGAAARENVGGRPRTVDRAEVVRLYTVEKLKQTEIGRRLRCTQGAVRQILIKEGALTQ